MNDAWYYGSRALLRALRCMPAAAFSWPTESAQLAPFAALVGARIADLHGAGVVGFVDGLSLTVEKPRDHELQNAYYSGFTTTHQVGRRTHACAAVRLAWLVRQRCADSPAGAAGACIRL